MLKTSYQDVHGFDESLRMDQGSLFLPEDDENVINAKIRL